MIETNNFAFEVKVNFGLNYTFPGEWVAGENENRTKLSFSWVEVC